MVAGGVYTQSRYVNDCSNRTTQSHCIIIVQQFVIFRVFEMYIIIYLYINKRSIYIHKQYVFPDRI